MAITDWLVSTPGGNPGATTQGELGTTYLNLAKMTYEQEAALRMQNFVAKASGRAARQVTLRGYETRIPRLGKATLQQRARNGFLGDDVTGGVQTAESSWATYVIRGAHWEYPEFFDLRDELGLDMLISSLTGGQFLTNLEGSFNRKAESIFFTALDADVTKGDGGGTETYFAGGGTEVNPLLKQDGTSSTLVTRMHHRKLLEGLSIQQRNDAWVGPSDNFLGIHPIQFYQLLTESSTPLTSADYNSLRPLMSGEVTTYLGYTWIMSTDIPAVTDIDTGSAGNQAGHSTYFWNKAAMVNGYGMPKNWVKDAPWRGDSVLLYHGAFFGALRMDSTGVTFARCADSMTIPAI